MVSPASGRGANLSAAVLAEPLLGARIEPTMFGNFMELLDDVVPGSWAEMLNDRSFAGVIPTANWVYYDGSFDICDRQWDTNSTWTYDSDNPFNGKRCARLTAAGRPASLTQSGLSVRKGLTYNFSAYIRGGTGVKPTANLKALLPNGEWFTLASAELPAPAAEWQKVAVTMTAAGETGQGLFELRAEGQGQLWVNKLSLMPGDNRNGWRADVLDAIKEIKPGILRWGGSTVDPGKYRWKNGIGDRDQRTPWKNENWGRIDPNDVGIDEFCQFCELAACEPLVCVSYSDGPRSAHDLVEYCNGGAGTAWGAKRIANGHSAPYNVKYWEVGNEINGDNPEYIRQFSDFISAIRAADPHSQIMTTDPSQRLLDAVGRDVNFVCPHYYTTDLNYWEQDIGRISRMIDQTPGCSHIKIGVTEWNIDAGAWGLGRRRQATLSATLLNARFLNLMMRHSNKVKIANRSNLANSFCGATILTAASGVGVLRQGSHYVMKLYSLHYKPVPVATEQHDDGLDLAATAADDMKSVALFVVNPTKEDVTFSPAFKGFETPLHITRAEGVCDPLNRGQPDVVNNWGQPERITTLPLAVANGQVLLPPYCAAVIEAAAAQ
jgi:alpha-L-arabinofuranosidase